MQSIACAFSTKQKMENKKKTENTRRQQHRNIKSHARRFVWNVRIFSFFEIINSWPSHDDIAGHFGCVRSLVRVSHFLVRSIRNVSCELLFRMRPCRICKHSSVTQDMKIRIVTGEQNAAGWWPLRCVTKISRQTMNGDLFFFLHSSSASFAPSSVLRCWFSAFSSIPFGWLTYVNVCGAIRFCERECVSCNCTHRIANGNRQFAIDSFRMR